MADNVRDEPGALSRRSSERRSDRITAAEYVYRSWQISTNAALRERALMREWTVHRNATGREVVEGALYHFVRDGVRQLVWLRATGRADPKLESALHFFLKPETGEPTARDYINAAYVLARNAKGGEAGATARANLKGSSRTPGQASDVKRAALDATRRELERLKGRRESVATRIAAASARGQVDAAVKDLRLQLTHLNERIADLQRGSAPDGPPSPALDGATSQSSASRELKGRLARLSSNLEVVRQARASKLAPQGVVSSARHFLRHAQEYGVRLRNNMVPLDMIHPNLRAAISRVLARV